MRKIHRSINWSFLLESPPCVELWCARHSWHWFVILSFHESFVLKVHSKLVRPNLWERGLSSSCPIFTVLLKWNKLVIALLGRSLAKRMTDFSKNVIWGRFHDDHEAVSYMLEIILFSYTLVVKERIKWSNFHMSWFQNFYI